MTDSAPTAFDFPAARLAAAQTRVDRFARKAAKLGMTTPTIRVVCEYDITTLLHRDGARASGPFTGFAPLLDDGELAARNLRRSAVPMVRVEVTGERPIIAGWEFAATIEHTGEGNFVWAVPGMDIPREYRDASATLCDHCRTKRDRNQTYVVRNVETGDHKRVGSSCLQDHLGDASPATWLACYQFIRDMEEFASDDYDGGLGGDSSAPIVSVLTFVALTVAVVRSQGFVSAGSAHEGNPSTGGLVFGQLTNPKTRMSALDLISADDYAKARECLAWLATQDNSSGFIYNAQLAAKQAGVSHKTCKLLAAVVPSFDRELVAAAQQAAKLNEHLAVEVGARPVLDLLVEHVTGYPTEWGYTTIVRFLDGAGRTIVWKTSTDAQDVDGNDVVTGASFRVVGTVKALNDYKGTAQTELSRCKLYPAGSEAKPLATAMRKHCKAQGCDVPAWAWTASQKKRAEK